MAQNQVVSDTFNINIIVKFRNVIAEVKSYRGQ